MKNYKFSIITPTHLHLPYINELWESIKAQTYKKWEWVIYLNGQMRESLLDTEIQYDKRVKIYKQEVSFSMLYTPRPNRNIGYLKKTAFLLGEGDILVEADHDDILTSDCLEELNKAFQKKVGFVYSDCATIGQKKPFSPELGWTSTEYKYKGKKLISMDAFEPTADKVSSMWFSPHHVRAWKKKVYKKLGGHDESLFICDDLDLIIRTFLKSKMHHIPKTLYIYRITGGNSYLRYASEISSITKTIQAKYRRELEKKGLHKPT